MDKVSQKTISCFEAIADKQTRVLILGTLPGPESLSTNQYYSSPRNSFWRIIFDIFNQPSLSKYSEKCAFLLRHQIGIWDVLGSANREGYADSNIHNPVPNDFANFLKQHPQICGFVFNGKDAEDAFHKAFPDLYDSIKHRSVLSSSGALARKYEEKLDSWKSAIENLMK